MRESLTFVHSNNKGAGLSSYPRSLISAFIVRFLESITSELAYCKTSYLACLCSWTDWFETYSVRNLQDSFLAAWPLRCILPLILTSGLKKVKGIICVKLLTIGAGIQLNSFGNNMGNSYFGQN